MVAPLDHHLVTNLRFEAFMEDRGYASAELWTPEGWLWRNDGHIEAPRFWANPEWSHFAKPSQPVIGVSWYEADAYCRWVGRRLPAESDWEAAVRGHDGRLFPWGHEWRPGLVGNRGVGPCQTWPVGSWPGAVGPLGHHDLVGNVWQWTRDVWQPGDDCMAVRGGSWASPNHQLRADHRNGYPKTARPSHVGFRTAARPAEHVL